MDDPLALLLATAMILKSFLSVANENEHLFGTRVLIANDCINHIENKIIMQPLPEIDVKMPSIN